MCSSEIIVYVANRQVNGPVCVVTCTDGDCSFIAAKNDGAENRAMRLWILRNDVLKSEQYQFTSSKDNSKDSLLVSRPITQT
jgi:hypothetical protein